MSVTMQRGLIVALTLFVLGLAPVTVFAVGDSQQAGGEFSLPKVVAKVNGVEIQSKTIAFQLNRTMRESHTNFSPDEQRKVIKAIVDKEIVRELVYQEGKSEKVDIAPEAVDKELKAIMEPYKNKEEFDKALKARGLTEEELRESIKVDLTAKKLINDQVRGEVNISDADVKKYYEENKEKFSRPEAFRASHIFIAIYPPELVKKSSEKELRKRQEELDKEAEKKINGILKELKAGGDFAELAKKYSHDKGSAPQGGDLDFIYKGVFDPEFDAAISKMKAGETSGVVKTSYGYHLIKLVETKPAEQASYAEMEVAIQKHLFMEKAQERVGHYLKGLKKKAKIEIFL
jgi:parvulin-like peptidyl-prolyl isomerase